MKYVIGVIAVVVIMFIAVIAISNRGGNEQRRGTQAVSVSDYATRDARVEFTTYGEITAQEERRAIRISVSPTERYIEILEGYEEQVARRESFGNIELAYEEFLMALDKAGYGKKREAPDDRSGFCPLGNRYTYRLSTNGQNELDLWSTSCNRNEGSFAGNSRLVQQLFERQIPNYDTVVRGVRL